MSFDKWASDLADYVRNRYNSLNPEDVRRMFACRKCGVSCDSSPGYGQAICPTCCEDHEFEYHREFRTHACRHCETPVDVDWYAD